MEYMPLIQLLLQLPQIFTFHDINFLLLQHVPIAKQNMDHVLHNIHLLHGKSEKLRSNSFHQIS